MYLSEEIDEEFEAEEEAARSAQNEEKAAITEELNYIFEDDVDESVTDQNRSNAVDLNSSQVSNVSLNRSGLAQVNSVYVDDASTQTDAFYDQPEVRHTTKYTQSVKCTCVKVLVKCGISAEKYCCTKEEALENDPSLAEYKNNDGDAPKEKKPHLKGPKS